MAFDELRTALVIAHECRPFNDPAHTVGAQRPYELAKWLPEWGWRVEVLTRPHGPAAAPVRVGARGESVIVPVTSRPSRSRRERWHGALTARSGRAARAARSMLTLALLPSGDWSRSWRPAATRAAIERIESGRGGSASRVDVVVGEYGPDSGLWAARDAARATGLPWVGDFRDPWLRAFPPGRRAIPARFYRHATRGVAAVIDVSESLSDGNSSLTRARGFVVPNGYDPDDVPARNAERTFRLLVFGSLPANNRLDIVADALRLVATPSTGLVVEYRGYDPERFLDVFSPVDSPSIEVRAGRPVDRDAHLADAACASALLIPSFGGSVSADPLFSSGIVPARLLEVLPLGVPVIMVPGDGGLGDDLLDRTGVGVVASTPEQVAATLEDWSRAHQAGVPCGPTPDRSEIEKYSRRALAGRFAAVLDEVVNRH